MKEINKEAIEYIEAEDVETTVEEKESIMSKAKNGIKKHGKKIAAGAAVAAVALVGIALKRKHRKTEIELDDEADILDVDDDNSEESDEEN